MKMKKLFLLFIVCCLWGICEGKALEAQNAHIKVTLLPHLGTGRAHNGCVFATFRCTNRTAQTLPLEIILNGERYRDPHNLQLSRKVYLPGLSTSEISLTAPQLGRYFSIMDFKAVSESGVIVSTSGSFSYNNGNGVASPAFRPDIFEYLFTDFRKAPMPVKEWPADSRAYSNPGTIVLDSTDELPQKVKEALRLAAARGGRIIVLVMGNAPWPEYAGVERKGKPFVENIGFGEWVVLRSQAVDSNPKWKEFVNKKHSAGKRNKWDRAYRNIKWQESDVLHYLTSAPFRKSSVSAPSLPVPPIPLGMLTAIMCCFVAIIGPVNYCWLKKYDRALWCLVTIPLLSLFFTGAVITCVFVKEGFDAKSKGVVKTFLDQRTGLIAAAGGFSLYSPRSVGEFRFNSDDLLEFENPGKVQGFADREYVFAPSLLKTRMVLRYKARRSGYCSEKLVVTEKKDGIEVVNGLGVKLDSLYVSDSKGAFFKLTAPLEAGARALLQPVRTLPENAGHLAKNCYVAHTSEPFYLKPGVRAQQREFSQTINGRWK